MPAERLFHCRSWVLYSEQETDRNRRLSCIASCWIFERILRASSTLDDSKELLETIEAEEPRVGPAPTRATWSEDNPVEPTRLGEDRGPEPELIQEQLERSGVPWPRYR